VRDEILLQPLQREVVLSAGTVVSPGEQSHDVRVRKRLQR
jgi:hypothetical protein